MSKTKHTAGPWTQGYTLMTRRTRGWTPQEILQNDHCEGLYLFANFTGEDEGRGRIPVARFERIEDAAFAETAVNCHDDLLAALKGLLNEVCSLHDKDAATQQAIAAGRAAIAKAKA